MMVELEKLNLVKLCNFKWIFPISNFVYEIHVELSQGRISPSVSFSFDALSNNNSNTLLSNSVMKCSHVNNHLYVSMNLDQSASFS